MKYPHVLCEEKTIARVVAGASIARFGDGELSIIRGGNCVSQVYDSCLASELRLILGGTLHGKATDFVVGIPTLDERSPKLANWKKLEKRFCEFTLLHPPTNFTYGSAFISRPDSAPWIDTAWFFDQVESLWSGQDVVLVANGKRSLTREFLLEHGACSVHWIECPYRDAYGCAADLYRQIMLSPAKRVILCCGPTATILADKLAGAGKHAIDLGHIGMFWRRYMQAEK